MQEHDKVRWIIIEDFELVSEALHAYTLKDDVLNQMHKATLWETTTVIHCTLDLISTALSSSSINWLHTCIHAVSALCVHCILHLLNTARLLIRRRHTCSTSYGYSWYWVSGECRIYEHTHTHLIHIPSTTNWAVSSVLPIHTSHNYYTSTHLQ